MAVYFGQLCTEFASLDKSCNNNMQMLQIVQDVCEVSRLKLYVL